MVGFSNKLRIEISPPPRLAVITTRLEDKKLDPFDSENLDIGTETGQRQPEGLQWQHHTGHRLLKARRVSYVWRLLI